MINTFRKNLVSYFLNLWWRRSLFSLETLQLRLLSPTLMSLAFTSDILWCPLVRGIGVLFIALGMNFLLVVKKKSWLWIIGAKACHLHAGEHDMSVLAPKLGLWGRSAWHAKGHDLPVSPRGLSCWTLFFIQIYMAMVWTIGNPC